MKTNDAHVVSAPQSRRRFSEFADTGEWVEYKIGDFLTESREKGSKGDVAKKLTVKLWGKGVFEKEEALTGSANTQYYRRSAGQFIYSKLDFLNQAFGIIPEALDGFESTIDLPCFDIKPGLNPTYLLEYVQRESFYKKNGEIADGGRKARRIQPEVLFEMPIILPPMFEEQDAIAEAILSIDALIEAETEKLDALKDHKQGLMQQLFPAEGESLPRRRFRGFKDEWKDTKLGSIAVFSKGKGVAKKDIDPEGFTYCIRYGELYTTYGAIIDEPVSKTSVGKGELVLSQGGEVIVPASGEDANDIATASVVLRSEIALGGDLNIITSPLDGAFLAYYLSGARKRALAGMAQGNTVVHLYPSQLETLSLYVPSGPEQRKIASCLEEIDGLISQQRDEIGQLAEHKKGLLQQLFPVLDEVDG